MRKKNQDFIHNLRIQEIVPEGKCITKENDKVIFVEFAAPGDLIDLEVTKVKRNYTEGKPVRIIEPSPFRIEPVCSHFGTCGGCKWQHVSYEKQLEAKQKQVVDQLERFGKTKPTVVHPILASSKTIFYRNKLEFSFTNKRWLTEEEIAKGGNFDDRNGVGYHLPGRFDKVLDIDTCYLQEPFTNEIRNWLRTYGLEHQLSFFDHHGQIGLLRSLMVRTTSTGELMIILQFGMNDQSSIDKILSDLIKEFPKITSLNYVINLKKNITFGDLDIITFSGKDHITEQMGALKFRIGPKSFYQTNSLQAESLYSVVKDFSGLTGNELVYDLYSGAGTIAQYIASDAKRVIGIEYVEDAVKDAIQNAKLNNITNCEFHYGDIKEYMKEAFYASAGIPDVVITDPPRTGMHEDVLYGLIYLSPKKIVYVSCSPITQARDMLILGEKYTAARCQPVDMFPHTSHVENVLLLERMEP